MQQATLKFYLDIWEIAQKLKTAARDAPIESTTESPGTGILDMVRKLVRALQEQTSDPANAGFQPFPGIRALHNDFVQFYAELENSLPEEEQPTPKDLKLGTRRRRRLQDLITDFESVFNSEVAMRPIFVSVERTWLLQYLSPQTFLRDETDWRLYGYLPRIAQAHFEDAGKCLAYGLCGAATGLALQAVEATVRFFYYRHGGKEVRPDWGGMLSSLKKHLPHQDYCYPVLDRLRSRYRNAVMHGRAYSEAGGQEVSEAEAEDVFSECWRAARMLAAEVPRRPQLRLRIVVHPDLDFDTAVATFLFYWNPELPPVSSDVIVFDEAAMQGELVDSTLQPEVVLQATADRCLTFFVMHHLRVQDNYADTLGPLIQFISDRRSGKIGSRFGRDVPNETEVDLADLFEGIRLEFFGDPLTTLKQTWVMLDKFVARPLSANSAHLVTELAQRSAYDALCRESSTGQATG